MKKAIIAINILAILFAAGTLYRLSGSNYQDISLTAEKAQLYRQKIDKFNNIEKLREFSNYGINYQESLSKSFDKGMFIFNATTIVFLGIAFLNIVITVLPTKKPNHKINADGK